jgi:hypothetical protein
MKYIISLILFLSFSSISYACNINFLKFGSNPINFPFSTLSKVKKETNDIIIITSPINIFCNKVELNGTQIEFLFIQNQLVKIKIFRENLKDNLLLDIVISKYGDFKRSLAFEKNTWQGSQGFENSEEYASYSVVIEKNYRLEVIEIQSKQLLNLMTIYANFTDNKK